jgi:hypothetical protein
MPISFDLEELRKKYECVNYFETGLYDPREDVSTKKALSAGFDNVYCMEIRDDFVALGKELFKEEICKGRYNLILDDSINMKKYITNPDIFKNRTMFFLDAHVDNVNIKNFSVRCPLFYELEAIKSLDRKDNIILIDDLRILSSKFPWGENAYGNINFLQEIMKKIFEINDNYQLELLDGYVKNDVLLAYI